MKLYQGFKIALAAQIMLLGTSAGAWATEAAATTALNVRTGPGTGYGVVDTLTPGEIVEVTECQANGWCHVDHEGPDGWVSSSYLTMAPAAPESSDPDCQLKLTIGPAGPSLQVICGGGDSSPPAPPAPPAPSPVGDQACFYVNASYTGTHFCYGVGSLSALNATFNDKITSVRIDGAAKARLCVNTNLGGYCRVVTGDVPLLGALINNRASSVTVFTGASPAPGPIPLPIPVPIPSAPQTYKTGLLSIASSFTANLDAGTTGGAGADIWHNAINAAIRQLSPRNGAKIARGDGSNRGYAGCKVASYSAAPVPFAHLQVGTYVCVKTDQGRISQFRVNGFTGTTMEIGFTTWKN